ncbi:hypothetical protein BWQ96_00979 [Gracilariopsis chorda]|uniref:DUF218 domain-containing protein n=1 Tax=Gracilariopsis chorda TaxID=448386 RepID=A0A2V3J779_9FLOR|nr:hypothetical protein BWQ96_00979 [Gracilariopsis chorda]|eukprot:PXF49190.1 hypothetical protein BWQ96_00979 [Gracilariopsis chorda]
MDSSAATHAIVVCGHAVYLGGRNLSPTEATDPSNWALLTFQHTETAEFINHVRKGVSLASQDPKSLLIFSGGQTRAPHLLSEAQGYHDIALLHRFWGHEGVAARTTTEEFSRDSYDNVVFGIARFFECTKRFPDRLTTVSWPFKEQRFQFHVRSIKWPNSRFNFLGVGVPSDKQVAVRAARITMSEFEQDPAGYGHILGEKKQSRNPFQRQNGYAISCPAMTKVLDWKGPEELASSCVPWAWKDSDNKEES